MTYRPPPVRQPFGVFSLVTNPRKRHAQVFLVAVAAALVAAAGATADPSVSAKQAQAQQVLGQINSIDVQLGAAVEAYNNANVQLAKIQGDLRDNTFELETLEEVVAHFRERGGFVWSHWCGEEADEARIKAEAGGVTIRTIEEMNKPSGKCLVCGKPAKYRVSLAKAY